jgi:hypothetical protein
MKNFYKVVSGLSLSALMVVSSFSFTACNDDDLDTNPYNKSGVSLVAMGPMPVSRLDQIRITGTQLNKVNEIIFPAESGVGEVKVTDFTLESSEEIKVTVPDASIPGHIKLVAGTDTITSLSLITFVEPIQVDKVSPVDNLNAGDIITIDGEYVYNIATATFTDGVVVEAPDFVYTSRKQVKIAVPKEAVSGELVLSDGDENDPQEFIYDITINSAAVTALDRSAEDNQIYEFGDKMTLTGHNFDLIESVTFPSNIEVPFDVNAEGTQLTVTVPDDCCSGQLTLAQFSGLKINSPDYVVPTVAITAINDIDVTTDNYKLPNLFAGDKIVLKGKYLKRVKEFYLPNADTPAVVGTDYTVVSDNQIEFTVPEGMSDGQLTLVQNASITVYSPSLTMQKMGNVVWQGKVEMVNWGGSFGIYTWSGDDWTNWTQNIFNETGTLTLTFTKTTDPAYLKLTRTGDWTTPFDNVKADSRFDEGSGALLLNGDVSEVSFDVTEADIAAIQDSGFTFYGSGITLTMIEYRKGAEITVFEPNQDMGNYSINLELNDAQAFVNAGVKAGQYLRLYCTPTADYNYDDPQVHIQIFDGHWGGLTFPECNGGQFNEVTWGDMTKIEIYITEELAEKMLTLTDWSYCMIFQGKNIILNKVTVGN